MEDSQSQEPEYWPLFLVAPLAISLLLASIGVFASVVYGSSGPAELLSML